MLSEDRVSIHTSPDDIDRSEVLSHEYQYDPKFLKLRYELRRDRPFSDEKYTKYLMQTHLTHDLSISFDGEVFIRKKTIMKLIRVYDDDLFFYEVRF